MTMLPAALQLCPPTGPTAEQRRQQDAARAQLQADLEAQIREKKERQVRLAVLSTVLQC
jgi:hypothetical protein